MNVKLIATPSKHFNFCSLLRPIIISSVHGAFSLSSNVHTQNIGDQEFD